MYSKSLKLAASLILLLISASAATAAPLQTRIVGGSRVDIAAVPSTVALIQNQRLEQTGSFFQSQFCGGTVISPRFVVTAAHCLVSEEGTPIQPATVSVLMGSTDLNQPVNQPVGVVSVTLHPEYVSSQTSNDIALLELEFDALVASVAIDDSTITLNDSGFVAGWGALQEAAEGQDQTFPNELHGAFVSLIPGTTCDTRFPDYTGQISDRQLCAGVPDGGVDSCQGDSGGPLYRVVGEGAQRVVTLVGITSFGIGCGRAETPGVYTSTRSYGDWLRQQTSGTTTTVANDPTPDTNTPTSTDTNTSTNEPTDVTTPATANEPATQVASDTVNQQQLVDSFAGGGGGAIWLILPVLLLISLTRTAGAAAQQSNAGEQEPVEVSVLELPISSEREVVIADAQELWQARAVCTTLKTGFGVNRRAYFFETCSLASTVKHTLCDASPSMIEYSFFEGSLVQVGFEFSAKINADNYVQCMLQPVADNSDHDSTYPVRLHTPAHGKIIEIAVDKSLRTTVSDRDTVADIHLLQNTL